MTREISALIFKYLTIFILLFFVFKNLRKSMG